MLRNARTDGRHFASFFISRASGLGVAFALERSLAFAAGLLAARIAGPQAFGAYVTAVTTANTVASYAGSAASAVGMRFAPEYARDPSDRLAFLCSFALMTVSGAAVGAAVMVGSARMLAEHLLSNAQLASLLQVAAVLTAGAVLLEGLRGMLIGWPEIKFLILMAAVGGGGLLVAIPRAAAKGAGAMVHIHALVIFSTVASIVILFVAVWRRGLTAGSFPGRWRSVLAQVAKFAGVQVAGFGGVAAASWFLAAMVARSDPSLHEMAFYGVGGQLRVLVLAIPAVLTQAVYPLLTGAGEKENEYGDPDRVMVSGTVITTVPVLIVGCFILATLPFVVSVAYGSSYQPAEMAYAAMVISGVVHVSRLVPANRLGVVAVRRLAVLNAGWTGLVFVGAAVIVPVGGAVGAALVLLVAEILSCVLALRLLRVEKQLDRALSQVSMITFASAIGLMLIWAAPVGGTLGRGVLSLAVAMTGAIMVLIVDRVLNANDRGGG
jgi:O-antigen/teichoic acid export membrane protein